MSGVVDEGRKTRGEMCANLGSGELSPSAWPSLLSFLSFSSSVSRSPVLLQLASWGASELQNAEGLGSAFREREESGFLGQMG